MKGVEKETLANIIWGILVITILLLIAIFIFSSLLTIKI